MILFRILLLMAVMVVFSATNVKAAIYTWTDDSGNIHMVDDEEKIPPEYRDKAIEAEEHAPPAQETLKRRPVIGGAAVRAESSGGLTEADFYGGHTLLWWKNAIDEKRAALKSFQDEFEIKKGYVDAVEIAYALRRAYKRVESAGGLGPATGVTYKDRRFLKTTQLFTGDQVAKYNRYKEEVEGAEGIIKRLNEALEDILRDARLNDVPKSVRGE